MLCAVCDRAHEDNDVPSEGLASGSSAMPADEGVAICSGSGSEETMLTLPALNPPVYLGTAWEDPVLRVAGTTATGRVVPPPPQEVRWNVDGQMRTVAVDADDNELPDRNGPWSWMRQVQRLARTTTYERSAETAPGRADRERAAIILQDWVRRGQLAFRFEQLAGDLQTLRAARHLLLAGGYHLGPGDREKAIRERAANLFLSEHSYARIRTSLRRVIARGQGGQQSGRRTSPG